MLKITGVPPDRALLVGVEFVSRPSAVPRSLEMASGKFVVPQREGAVLAALAGALILKREFSGGFVDLAVAGPASLLARYHKYRKAQTGLKVK